MGAATLSLDHLVLIAQFRTTPFFDYHTHLRMRLIILHGSVCEIYFDNIKISVALSSVDR